MRILSNIFPWSQPVTNSWKLNWGSGVTNALERVLLESIVTLDMVLLNSGDTPTFTRGEIRSIVHLTFINNSFTKRNYFYEVMDTYTASDRSAILREISSDQNPYRQIDQLIRLVNNLVDKISYYFTIGMLTMNYVAWIVYSIPTAYHNYQIGAFSNNMIANSTLAFSVNYAFPNFDTIKMFIPHTIIDMYLTYAVASFHCILDLYLSLAVFQIVGHLYILKHSLTSIPRPKNKTFIEVYDMPVAVEMFDDEENQQVFKDVTECISYHCMIISSVNKNDRYIDPGVTMLMTFIETDTQDVHTGWIKQSPYKAIFGIEPRVGLLTSSLPQEIINDIQDEDDLRKTKRMKASSDKSHPPANIGDNVTIPIPDVDKGKGDFSAIASMPLAAVKYGDVFNIPPESGNFIPIVEKSQIKFKNACDNIVRSTKVGNRLILSYPCKRPTLADLKKVVILLGNGGRVVRSRGSDDG
ncbi:hypothetical protein EVAR_70800_1 [Eumeta japonica]|uniref:Odorant receptor n=1 Tax=Eumeta variegata TaxID=151549 RepID=A0A4C1SF69_EUMVA|nr:hypothetical protein EVAR_70800_1 [Eumeta japonica]